MLKMEKGVKACLEVLFLCYSNGIIPKRSYTKWILNGINDVK